MTGEQSEMAQLLQAAIEMATQVRYRLPEPDGFISAPGMMESGAALVASLLAFTPGRFMALELIRRKFPQANQLLPNVIITLPILFLSVQYARFTGALAVCQIHLDAMRDDTTSPEIIENVCQDPTILLLQQRRVLFDSDTMQKIDDDKRYWDPRKRTLQALHRALRVCLERYPAVVQKSNSGAKENDQPEETFDFQPPEAN
jgi:hypothetical protein